MKLTQAHSKNAVAARALKRMEPPDFSQEVQTKIRVRRTIAKWTIQIRDRENGDSITISLHRLPWPARYVDTEGRNHSAASVGKMVATMLRDAP